jgi:hypothetical protein
MCRLFSLGGGLSPSRWSRLRAFWQKHPTRFDVGRSTLRSAQRTGKVSYRQPPLSAAASLCAAAARWTYAFGAGLAGSSSGPL